MLISSCRPTDIRADFIAAADTTTTATFATATISRKARKHFTIKLEEANKLMPQQQQQQQQPQTTSSM